MTERLWDLKPLGSVVTLQRGFDLPARVRRTGSVPVVSSSGVSGWHDRAAVRAPGIITGRYGTIGQVFFEDRDFWPLNTTLWVASFHGNHERFVYYILQRVNFATHSGKSGVPGVNRNDVHRELVSLPSSHNEQQAIAEALSDADALILALERLVTKKEAMQHGLVQELLTGRTRLPEFEEEWWESPLCELATIIGGGTPSSSVASYWGGGIPWCTPTDITGTSGRTLEATERTLTTLGLARSAARIVPTGSLLLCTRATVGDVKIARVPTATNQGFRSVVPREFVSGEFLYFALRRAKPALKALGSGSTFLEVSKRDVSDFRILIPPHDEQRAIARVLCDGDDEIEALRARLEKVKAIKQGMMQELLTGRTRLPVAAGFGASGHDADAEAA